MTRSARAREVHVLRRLPRWFRVRGLNLAGAPFDPSAGTAFDSDRFRDRVNASLGLVGGEREGESETLSRWS
jgi:hypothetical protein